MASAATPPIRNPNIIKDEYLETGIAERKYLTANAEYSDHAPIVYDLSPVNPFIKIITWNVANFGDTPITDKGNIIGYNHKFSITNNANFPNGKETEKHYNARLERIAKAISDLFKKYKPLADNCDPVFMCQELPSFKDTGDPNTTEFQTYKTYMQTCIDNFIKYLASYGLELLNLKKKKDNTIDYEYIPECNMIISKTVNSNINQGIIVIGIEKLKFENIAQYFPVKIKQNPNPGDTLDDTHPIFKGKENKLNRQFRNNLLYRSGYSYKIYFEKYLVIFVSVHIQVPIVCDTLITAMVATLIDQIDSIMAAKTTRPKYESLLSIIFAGDFNRSLANEPFTQLKDYLTRNNILASLNRYSAKPRKEGGIDYNKTSFGDNKGGYNADNVDCVLEVKFDPPRPKEAITELNIRDLT